MNENQGATVSDVAQAVPPNAHSMAQNAKVALLKVIAAASTVCDNICDIATAVPSDGSAKDVRPVLLASSDGVAKLIKSASDAVNTAIEGMRQIPALQAEEAVAAPAAWDGQSARADEGYPLRSEMEAYDRVVREGREAKSTKVDEPA